MNDIINITKEKAVKILNDRLRELDLLDFDPISWKSRTVADLKIIFKGIDQYSEILRLSFYDFEGTKNTSKKIIEGYISYINEYVFTVPPPPTTILNHIPQPDFKKLNDELTIQMQNLLAQKNRTDNLLKTAMERVNQQQTEIKILKSNVFQLKGLTLKRLFGIFPHLTIESSFKLSGFMLAIFSFVFWLGVFFVKRGWI